MSSSNSLKLMFWNAQGISNAAKRMQLAAFLADNLIDVVMLAETFLNEQHIFHLPNYSIYRSDRTGHGGGVAVAVSNKIQHVPVSPIETESIENISINVTVNGRETVIVAAYCPHFSTNFSADVREITSWQSDFIIMGDLNAKHTGWNCQNVNAAGKKINGRATGR